MTPTPAAARASLACLAEAGLLERLGGRQAEPRATPPRPREEPAGSLVSAVVVAYNGARWLEGLLPSLAAQTWKPLEIVVVDNGSRDDTSAWVLREHPGVRLLRLDPGLSLAGGINRGVAEARGEHFFILNQDITLDPDAVAQLVAVAGVRPLVRGGVRQAAAHAHAGLPERPRQPRRGPVVGLGHRHGSPRPRAVRRMARGAVELLRGDVHPPAGLGEGGGEVDEGFPLYYEDSEWCYRARAHGLRVCLAPSAVAYHAFGGSGDAARGSLPPSWSVWLTSSCVFALKLLPAPEAWQFVRAYLAEDLRELRGHLLRGRLRAAGAYAGAWSRVIADIPGIAGARRRLGGRRASPTSIRAGLPQRLPDARVEGSSPRLTSSDMVRLRSAPPRRKDPPHARDAGPATPRAAPREPGRGGPPHGGPGPALPRDGPCPVPGTWTSFSPSRTARPWTCRGCTS